MKKELLRYVPLVSFLNDALRARYHVELVDSDEPACESEVPAQSFDIKDEKGEIVGSLCIYEKREGLYPVREVLDQLLTPEGQYTSDSGCIEAEVNSILREKIVEVWKRHNTLTHKMKKSHKIAFISELFEMGIFRMKGAAVHVSEVTGISQASVYRYLGEVLEE